MRSAVPVELGGERVSYTFTSGREAMAAYGPERVDQITRFVESRASIDDVRRATAFRIGSDGVTLIIEGLQIIGTDAKAWLEPYSQLFIALPGMKEPRIQERVVGGKNVLRISDRASPGEITHLYPSGDTVWLVAAQGPLLFEAVRRIPVRGGGAVAAPSSGSGESVLRMIADGQSTEDIVRRLRSQSNKVALSAYVDVLPTLAALVEEAKRRQAPPTE